jgi:hypothetical protein
MRRLPPTQVLTLVQQELKNAVPLTPLHLEHLVRRHWPTRQLRRYFVRSPAQSAGAELQPPNCIRRSCPIVSSILSYFLRVAVQTVSIIGSSGATVAALFVPIPSCCLKC